MNNLTAIAVDRQNIHLHELIVVTEVRPDFLPQVTFAAADGHKTLLYSTEGIAPLARYIERPDWGGSALDGLFMLLTGYIRALLTARDMLLDTALLSSDPEEGVFVLTQAARSDVKVIWGADDLTDTGEKICRIAHALSKSERIMGAKTSMERMIYVIRTENPSLLACLKLAESLCREWNYIVQ